MDVYTFVFVGVISLAASYLALKPTREGDIDNLYTGGFAFLNWILWAWSAYGVEFSVGGGETVVRSYPPLAYLGVIMSIIMLIGLVEEVLVRLDLDEQVKKSFGLGR